MNEKEPMFDYLESIAELIPVPFWWMNLDKVALGCNEVGLRAISASKKEDYVGKNPFGIYNDKKISDQFEEWIDEVIRTNVPLQKEHYITDLATKKIKYFSGTFAPLYNAKHKLLGVIGTSVDITAEKEAEKLRFEAETSKVKTLQLEKESAADKVRLLELENKEKTHAAKILQFQNEAYAYAAKEQDKFRRIADQVVHDIRSPLMSLTMLVKQYQTTLPEQLRNELRSVTSSITDIANRLFSEYRYEDANYVEGQKSPLLIVTELSAMLTEKRYEYSEHAIEFIPHFSQDGYFAFINAEALAIKRMVSNLINNAVDALQDKTGSIDIHLDIVDNKVRIIIADNGKGMPEAVKQKILNNMKVTYGKSNGSGIGFTQIRETIAYNEGTLDIQAKDGVGTKIVLTFTKITNPAWIADTITLNHSDTLVVLDDDDSIHGAWDGVFKQYAPNIPIKHFRSGITAIEFINNLSSNEKDNIFLLTDYELLKQNINGLDVIKQTNIKRSILVTSHHTNPEVLQMAELTNTKILPKLLAHEIPVSLRT